MTNYPQTIRDGATAAPSKGLSISSLVLSLVSIPAGFTFVLPVIALVLGIVGLKFEQEGRAQAKAGIVISSILLAIWIVIVVIVVIVAIGLTIPALSSEYQNVYPLE
ncbi:DUF4190 domain-containing protein [Leifsonia sp. McL0607]|uniref:DUF4190 domain-containing protein n=1 Tax=Leifsonia sp. McL0607 TaxID=3415672 RepID=UPI003CE9ECEB